MLKAQNRIVFPASLRLHLVIILVIVSVASTTFAQSGKSTIYLHAPDSLLITADEYVTSDTFPYLVLLHEQGSSRGEYADILPRFQKMNFNCLVPDLRNGGNSIYVANETAKRSRNSNYGMKAEDIEGDIRACVTYATQKSGKKVVLVGAGANGSLAIKACKEIDSVQAVIALSPGEFFRNQFSVEDTIAGIEKPVLVLSSEIELPYMEQLLSQVDKPYKTLYVPENHGGLRGSGSLKDDNPSQSGYWLSILLFFKELQ